MDGHEFDQRLRAIAASRRSAIAGVVVAISGIAGWSDIEARKKKRKCKSPKVKCGKKCLPAGSCCSNSDCGTCQVCSGNQCVLAPAGSACGVGGTCNGTSCINEGAFGCTLSQDFCDDSPRISCSQSSTPGAICITDNGKPRCVVGGCIFGNTPQACEAAFGTGAQLKSFCSPCALGGPNDPRNGCFRQVTQ